MENPDSQAQNSQDPGDAQGREQADPVRDRVTRQVELPFEARVLNQILFGSRGLRAGWRALLFVAGFSLFAALAEIALTLVSGHLAPIPTASQAHTISAGFVMRSEFDSVVGMIGGFVAVMLLCRQSPREYFLVDRRWLRRIASGAVSGFFALSVLMVAIAVLHCARFASGPGLRLFQALGQAAFWALTFLMVALFEEGTFRCFLVRTLLHGLRGWMSEERTWWLATVLSSLVFGGIHWTNHGESLVGISSAAAIGFIFCCTLRWTGSVWWAVGFHAAWDWAQTYFYGTADSGLMPETHWLVTTFAGPARWTGGATGPEGSLLILPLLVLVLFGTYLVFGRRHAAITD